MSSLKSRPKSRPASVLSPLLRSKLDKYGLAAAAGIGLAALTTPAQGEVVFTPAHQEVGRKALFLDLNHDGIPDFDIHRTIFALADSAGVLVSSLNGNRVFDSGGFRGDVANLPSGYAVGPNTARFGLGGRFSSIWGPAKLLYNCFIFSGPPSCTGPWYKTQSAYVGFQFRIQGETHYGWARLKTIVAEPQKIQVILVGYAYETIADKPIVTGQTSGQVTSDESNKDSSEKPQASNDSPQSAPTLGMLSAGASAIPLWRTSLQ
jgi:hypothetical protein